MFDNLRIYHTDDPELLALGRPSTLAHWRSGGVGPAFIKLGKRVGYHGRALNDWIRQRTVEPRQEAA